MNEWMNEWMNEVQVTLDPVTVFRFLINQLKNLLNIKQIINWLKKS